MSVLILYPNQLYKATLALPKREVTVLLVEDSFHFAPSVHPDEQLQYRASLMAFRERLLVAGFHVSYVEANESGGLTDFVTGLGTRHKQLVGYALGSHPLAKERAKLAREIGYKLDELPTPGIYFSKEYITLQLPALRRQLHTLPEFGEQDRYVAEAFDYTTARLSPKVLPVQRLPIAYSDAAELVEHAVATPDSGVRTLVQKAVAWCLYQGLLTSSVIEEIITEHGAFHRVPLSAQDRLLRQLLGDTEYRWLRRAR